MKILAFAALLLAFVAALSECRSELQKSTPVGEACYRQFAYEESPRYYACLFELSDPSAFYDDKEVQKILGHFIADEGGQCVVKPERDVADVRTQNMDHGLRYRLFNIECR